MVGLAVIAMVGGSWPATVPDICLVAGLLITNIASQVTTPARMVLTATIVPPASRDIASSVTISTLMTLSIVVPPLGAPLYVLAGQEAAMLLNAASFAVSSWCFLRVPEVCGTAAPEHLTAGLLRSMRAGLATATRIVMVRRLLLLVFFAALCLSGLNSQMVLLCREMLGWDSERLGVLFGLVAASSLVGSIAAPVLARTVGPRVMAAAALTGVGAGLIFSGVTTHTGMVLTGLATVGASSGAFNVAVGPVLMNHCPRDSLGRVSALLRPLDSLGSLISIGLTGVLLTTLGEHRIIIGGWEWGRMSVLLIASGVLFIGTTVVVGRQLDYSTHSDPS
ncbi:hypothetical protein KEM60_02260 [Austwickia sp. TVS 96-490-7B]|nr:hypothetical protein [Austwickia sp. TVS 96-490-7B]